jgi:hypothetical protein
MAAIAGGESTKDIDSHQSYLSVSALLDSRERTFFILAGSCK